MVRIVKHKLNNKSNAFKNLTDAQLKKKICTILSKYSGVQVFDTQSLNDQEEDFETLFKYSNKILIRFNVVYNYLEIITYHLSLHDWIWTNFVVNDPDVSEGYLIK